MIDPKTKLGNDEMFSANAKLMYYRDKLKDKLRSKNPEAFDKLVEERAKLVRSSAPENAVKASDEFVEAYDFKESLSPEEVKSTLGDEYDDYIGTLKTIQSSGWDVNPLKVLAGANEDPNMDPSKLAYGKRFATMWVKPSYDETVTKDGKTTRKNTFFEYDPKSKTVNKIAVYR